MSLPQLDHTHDPTLRSWVSSANALGAPFPLQNLPLGVFRTAPAGVPRIGVAIGDQVLDLKAAVEHAVLDLKGPLACAVFAPRLNDLLRLGAGPRGALRHAVHALLRDGHPVANDIAVRHAILHAEAAVELLLPAEIGDYTDFYASIHHATNVGSMFRPDNPLLPNYKWVPVGYHGRASSVAVSGTPVRRPSGQRKPADAAVPQFGPTRQLDYELEIGAWIGPGNDPGSPIGINEAEDHIAAISLLNDWSARDVQTWEYQPLGPFLAKNFLTTVSPWMITWEALAPFRVAAPERPAGDPAPLPYLDGPADREAGAISVTLTVTLSSARMRQAGLAPLGLSTTDFRRMYWTLGQLVTHHASNGCNLRAGDLIGSGTVSGPGKDERGCLLELTWRGQEPITLPGGETRTFLEDGDEVVFAGWCQRPGAVRIGLGECRGIVEAGGT
ncbi:MAG: fumarylacetoacetase [Gemmatimonadales bacterium]